MSATRCLCAILIFLALLPAGCSSSPQLPLLSADATILAFGDSLTAGSGAGDAESYPEVLAQLTGHKVVNGGVPGEFSARGVERLPGLLEQVRPALLILCHGGNDLLARQSHQIIADNLRIMIRAAAERGVPVLLVAVPSPDLMLTPPDLYADVSKEFNIPLESEALSRILGKSSLKSDYVHPNGAGYRLLAEAVAKLLKKSGAI